MKKLLFSFAIASSFAVNAQQNLVDFENFPLSKADTFYNGADNAQGFTIQANFGASTSFSNFFSTSQWGDYWEGFAVSNMTDNQTAGYGNQYSSYVGNGSNQSVNYGVMYSNGSISFNKNTIIDSVKITNTTYTALSLLNGDSYGKKFGSSTNANGIDDGTNGEDFLRIWITGYDENGLKTDSVEFYLADYRGVNDYIVDSWTNVDLASLGEIKSMDFRFESSDTAFGYINNPTYFAIDDIAFSNVLKVKEISENNFNVSPNPVISTLKINGSEGLLTVNNLEGKTLLTSKHKFFSELDFSNFESGIYFISIENETGISTQKVIK